LDEAPVNPDARSRRVFTFHRPETLIGWSRQIAESSGLPTFRARLRSLPLLDERGLWGKQAEAISNVEQSLVSPRGIVAPAEAVGGQRTSPGQEIIDVLAADQSAAPGLN
jgi:type I restriction enzyme R subunit